jgi:hypothetical protein
MEFASPERLLLLIPAAAAFLAIALIRAPRRRGHYARTALRLAAILFGLAALAGPRLPSGGGTYPVLFLLDGSGSFRTRLPGALSFIREQTQRLDSKVQASLLVFGEEFSLEKPPDDPKALHTIDVIVSAVGKNASHLARGLRGCLDHLGNRGPGEIHLLSDGLPTDRGSREIALEAANRGIRIFSYCPPAPPWEDLRIVRVDHPGRIRQGEAAVLEVDVTYAGRRPTAAARLRVFAGGKETVRKDLTLTPGRTRRLSILLRPEKRGLCEIKVHLMPHAVEDAFPENNRLDSGLIVAGGPSILLTTREPGLIESLAERSGIRASLHAVRDLKHGWERIQGHDLLVLDNISSGSLSPESMAGIRDYVRNQGGGLLVLGGRSSYGPGGYGGSPLEEVLPVRCDPREERSFALALLIDRSGSMGERQGEYTKYERAVDALLPLRFLKKNDRLEVVLFNTGYRIAFPFRRAEDQRSLKRRLLAIRPGGGTHLFPALFKAFRDLEDERASARHILLLSDGKSKKRPEDLAELKRLHDKATDITISVIAVGSEPDADLLKGIADLAGGRYYALAESDRALEAIIDDEFAPFFQDLIREGEIIPAKGEESALLKGFEAGIFPRLFGMVLTQKKEKAQLALKSAGGEPLIAFWRAGLGKVAAFTSSVRGPWGRSWRTWPRMPSLLGRLITAVSRDLRGEGFAIRAEARESALHIAATARSETGFRNELILSARICPAGGPSEVIPLRQTGPGRYAGSAKTLPSRSALLALVEKNGEEPVIRAIGLYQPGIPREYARLEPDTRFLRKLAEITGGRLLRAGESLPDRDRAGAGPRDITGWFVLLCMFLYLADLSLGAFLTRGRSLG